MASSVCLKLAGDSQIDTIIDECHSQLHYDLDNLKEAQSGGGWVLRLVITSLLGSSWLDMDRGVQIRPPD
jgi:hypothetical protein